MKDLIIYLVKSIVNHPDDISVEENVSEEVSGQKEKTIYLINVNEEDIPLVIGKKGRTIKSIRNIAKIKAIKEGKYIDVSLRDSYNT